MTGGAPMLLDPSVSSDALDPTETVELLLRDLKTGRDGLSSREAQRRLVQFGPNELSRRGGRRWPRELARQFTHPLALLLVAAAGLAWVAGIVAVALAIVAVILINAGFAALARSETYAHRPNRGRAARDAHLVGVPRRRVRLQAEAVARQGSYARTGIPARCRTAAWALGGTITSGQRALLRSAPATPPNRASRSGP